eukprot:5842080-Prymnesium_polylepis.1
MRALDRSVIFAAPRATSVAAIAPPPTPIAPEWARRPIPAKDLPSGWEEVKSSDRGGVYYYYWNTFT